MSCLWVGVRENLRQVTGERRVELWKVRSGSFWNRKWRSETVLDWPAERKGL